MDAAYIVIAIVTAAANGGIAVADLRRARFVLANSTAVGVPPSWLTPLAALKGAGAVGIVLGLAGIAPLDTAAALGLMLFFAGAVIAHVRARNYALAFPLAYLGLAAATFVLSLAR